MFVLRLRCWIGLWLGLLSFAASAAEPRSDGRADDSAQLSNPVVVLRLSESALNGLWGNQVVDRQVNVRDCILGTSVYGQARVVGTPRLELVPSEGQAVVRVLFQGRTISRTTGYNGPAIIYSRTVTDFIAAKQIAAQPGGGFRAQPALTWASTTLDVEGIDSARPGLVGRIVRRRAARIGASQHSLATEIARQKAGSRIALALERMSQERLERLNRIAFLRRLASAAFWTAGQDAKPTYSLSTTSQHLQIGISFGDRPDIVTSPEPSPASGAPLELWIHQSLLGGRIARAIDLLSLPVQFTNQYRATSAIVNAIAGRWRRTSAMRDLAAEQPLQLRSTGQWRVIAWRMAPGQQGRTLAKGRSLGAPPAAPLRTWRSGPYHADAAFLALEGDAVQLLRTSGAKISVPLERLSQADQRWIRDYVGSNRLVR